METVKMVGSEYDIQPILDTSSEEDNTPPISLQGSSGSRTSSHGSTDGPQTEHVVQLSSIEHCMPRAYIRICLAYRVPSDHHLKRAILKLRQFMKQIVEAKPYLAGYVVDVSVPGKRAKHAEIRFTTHHYLNYPEVEVKTLLNRDGSAISYDELDASGLPPSRLQPEDVSALPPNEEPDKENPVLRVQANVVDGGLIVSIYLHHCISDGTGFDLITSGDLLNDSLTFQWPDESSALGIQGLGDQLHKFAKAKTQIRQSWSQAPSDLPNSRQLKARRLDQPTGPQNKPGRGCIMMIAADKITTLLNKLNEDDSLKSPLTHTPNSVLMALLWRHMTCARRPTVSHNCEVRTSKLLIPVNIRKRLREPLQDGYFGAAVDFGKAELDLDSLTNVNHKGLHEISHVVRQATETVDDAYVRQAIAFANSADAVTDVHDIQASNMNRVTGADMYITSWLKLRSYEHDLGMGLGGPEWVRKPWSRDPGSCIILPRKSASPEYYEVVAQMTEADMSRLLDDKEFMDYVVRVID